MRPNDELISTRGGLMDITAVLRRTLPHQAQLRLSHVQVQSNVSMPNAAQSATTVHLSEAARNVGNGTSPAASEAARTNAAEMREMLSQLDFRNIAPRQMAELGTELFSRNELTDVEASAFIDLENDFATTQPSDKALDAIAHFERLLADEYKYESENGTDNGIRFRYAGLTALHNAISFVHSVRMHIADAS